MRYMDAYDELTDVRKLTDEQAERMLKTACQYGLVNFEHNGEHIGVKFSRKTRRYGVGRADFKAAAELR